MLSLTEDEAQKKIQRSPRELLLTLQIKDRYVPGDMSGENHQISENS
jgi:hypothetical protein